MKLSKVVRGVADGVLKRHDSSIRQGLVDKARVHLIRALDLRKQDERVADDLLQHAQEYELFWEEGRVKAYLQFAPGMWSPPFPDYCGDFSNAVARVEETLEGATVDVLDPGVTIVFDDEVISRLEVLDRLVDAVNEAAKLATLLEPLDRQQIEGLKVALVPLVGALKSAGNTGELLALLRQLASHECVRG